MLVKALKENTINSQWVFLLGIYLLAVFLRLRLNFAQDLIPGVNGGYYPLMIRGIIEKKQLLFQDLPMLFWLEALFTRILSFFIGTSDSTILLATKLFDSLIPAFILVPIYFHSRRQKVPKESALLLASFVVLFFPFSYLLSGDLHKNALALAILAFFFSGLEAYRKSGNIKTGIACLLLLIFIGLTHFGTFLIAGMAIPLLLGDHVTGKNLSLKKMAGKTLPIIVLLGGILLLIFLIPDRMNRLSDLIRQPLRIFEQALWSYILTGQKVLTPFLMTFILSLHLLSFFVLIHSFFTKKGIYWAGMAFILSSPLIGFEWIIRLAMMAHVPLIFSITAQWEYGNKYSKLILQLLLVIFLSASVYLAFMGKKSTAIAAEEIQEFAILQSSGILEENTLLVTRHGLEWWTAWYLRKPIAQEQAVTEKDFDIYDKILIVNQFKSKKDRYQRVQSNFYEPQTHPLDLPIWEGNVFRIYQANPQTYPFVKENLELISTGKLFQKPNGDWWVQNQSCRNPLILTENQKKELSSTHKPLTTYRVYGRRKPFSLAIQVAELEEL